MGHIKYFFGFLILSVITLAVLACTESPFGENDISGGSSTISGKVMLDTNIVAKNALVWLDGIGVSTRTNDAGEFKLEIPPGGAQGGTRGYTGTLILYYYFGNFKLGKTALALQEGNFIYDSGPVDKKGKISKPIILEKLLDIDIELQPPLVILGTNPQVRITVTLTANDSVSVYFPGTVDGTIGPISILDKSTGDVKTVQTTIIGVTSGPSTKNIAAGESQRREYSLGLGYFEPKTADYEIIPYLLLKHETMPTGLFVDPDGGSYTNLANYWKLPFDRTGSLLSVQKGDD